MSAHSRVLTSCAICFIALLFVFAMPAWTQQIPASDASADGVLVQLGPGDGVQVTVYGQNDMSGALTIAEDGTLSVPLVGAIVVKGLSTTETARAIEKALRGGQILNDPHVTVTLTQARSQRVSLLGEVTRPGRYAVQTDSTILDLIALAGGISVNGGNIIYQLRTQPDGSIQRREIRLGGLDDSKAALVAEHPQAGDTYFVPKAEQFYIYGQVAMPNMYRIEPGMTVVQAIARAGGITVRGSERRVDIKRTLPGNKVKTFSAKPFDEVQANDVIRVKESIF